MSVFHVEHRTCSSYKREKVHFKINVLNQSRLLLWRPVVWKWHLWWSLQKQAAQTRQVQTFKLLTFIEEPWFRTHFICSCIPNANSAFSKLSHFLLHIFLFHHPLVEVLFQNVFNASVQLLTRALMPLRACSARPTGKESLLGTIWGTVAWQTARSSSASDWWTDCLQKVCAYTGWGSTLFLILIVHREQRRENLLNRGGGSLMLTAGPADQLSQPQGNKRRCWIFKLLFTVFTSQLQNNILQACIRPTQSATLALLIQRFFWDVFHCSQSRSQTTESDDGDRGQVKVLETDSHPQCARGEEGTTGLRGSACACVEVWSLTLGLECGKNRALWKASWEGNYWWAANGEYVWMWHNCSDNPCFVLQRSCETTRQIEENKWTF